MFDAQGRHIVLSNLTVYYLSIILLSSNCERRAFISPLSTQQ